MSPPFKFVIVLGMFISLVAGVMGFLLPAMFSAADTFIVLMGWVTMVVFLAVVVSLLPILKDLFLDTFTKEEEQESDSNCI